MTRAALLAITCLLVSGLACGDDGSGGTGTGTITTGGTDTTTGGTDTTATDTAGTTTDDPTTGTTGPICDPGGVHCVCDDGACQPGLTCVDDLCVFGLECDDDLGEPDDDESSAHDLGEVTDDDDEKLMAAGVLSGVEDVDWYTYHGLDTFGHVAETAVQITSSDAVRLCQFLECDQGGPVMTELTCPANTQQALSGQLRPGCCGIASFTISDFNCPGSSDDVRVFIRVDKADADACIDYTLAIHH